MSLGGGQAHLLCGKYCALSWHNWFPLSSVEHLSFPLYLSLSLSLSLVLEKVYKAFGFFFFLFSG